MDYPLSYIKYLEQNRKICTDSRQVIQDSVFVALNGPHFDGNKFAFEALEKGAAYAIVDQIQKADSRLILVDNTLSELQKIANINRHVNHAKIIAITGTNGKTTTKELCHSIFSGCYHCISTQGNLNNHIGVPLSLLRINEETDYAIIEMGANRPGDIDQLCQIADPDIGLITNIGKAHLEGFKDLRGVFETKMELFKYLKRQKGLRVFNLFSEAIHSSFLPSEENYVTVGPDDDSNYSGILKQSFPDLELEFINRNERTLIHSSLFGEYNYQNILCAAAIAAVCNVPSEKIRTGVANYIPGNMRSQIVKNNSNTIILDAYNANPSSMHEALDAFAQMQFESKWIILGEMAELGAYKKSEHQLLVDKISKFNFDQVILIGDQFYDLHQISEVKLFRTVAECQAWLQYQWPENAGILIKGSRSAKLETLMN